jgi:hypothetical protein
MVRMGSLIWTSPTALKLQINRVDVFANNRSTHSFNRRDLDYAHGCGFFDIEFVDFGDDVFPKEGAKQNLSVYEGLLTVNGQGITAQILAWHEQDVMAFQINDQRRQPTAINARLRMLRPAEVDNKNHSAISTLHIREDKIVLKQEFKEGDYFCSSAVVVGVIGRDAMPRLSDATGGKIPIVSSQKWRTPGLGQPTETEIRLAIKPGKGAFTILVASAASFDSREDVIAMALKQFESAKAKGFETLLTENKKWWHDYWTRAFVHLHSADGIANEIEKHYTYFLYLMVLLARQICADFSGMVFSTLGDAARGDLNIGGTIPVCIIAAFCGESFGVDGAAVRYVSQHVFRMQHRRAPSVKQQKNLYSRNRLVRRSGNLARRHCRGNARAVLGAQAVGDALAALPRICRNAKSADFYLELERRWKMGRGQMDF